jgi:hypothetical protein
MTKEQLSEERLAIDELIERCRKAEGPDRELDFLIHTHVVHPLTGDENYTLQDVMDDLAMLGPEGMTIDAPWTASIDAITALIEKELTGCGWYVARGVAEGRPAVTAAIYPSLEATKPIAKDTGATAPLALCLALLIALQSKETSDA